jgi:hypothetical protein
MTSVHAIISARDYNKIRRKIERVLGLGSGRFGWGQTLQSSEVSSGDLVAYDFNDSSITYSVYEGGSILFDVILTNSPAIVEETLFWTVSRPDDFNPIQGTFLVENNRGTFRVFPRADSLTEGVESFTVSIRRNSYADSPILTTNPINIIDASTATDTIPPPAASLISVQEYASLSYDIINCHKHIFGIDPILPNVNPHELVKYDDNNQPINGLNAIADLIIANKDIVANSNVLTEELDKKTLTWPNAINEYWNRELNSTVSISFNTAAEARYFFNSGSEIRLFSRRVGSTEREQNAAWTSLLNSVGTIKFGSNQPESGDAPYDGKNFYKLTRDYQEIYSEAFDSPYTALKYRILARAADLPSGVLTNAAGQAKNIDFFVQWIDGYVDPGDNPNDPNDPGDEVDGTIELTLSVLYPVTIFQPSGSINITQPQGSVGSIVQLSNGPLTGINTFVPVNQPFTPVNVPFTPAGPVNTPILNLFRTDYEFATRINEIPLAQNLFFSSVYGEVTVNVDYEVTLPSGFILTVDWTNAGGSGFNPPPGGSFKVNGLNNKSVGLRLYSTVFRADQTVEMIWRSTGGNRVVFIKWRRLV